MNDRNEKNTHGASAETDVDLDRQKTETELEILKLEAAELRIRVDNSKKLFSSRFLIEALIGGAVAGALFVSWFTGFYSPSIALERERLEITRDREKEQFERKLERITNNSENLLLEHKQFSSFVTNGNTNLLTWIRGYRDRIEAQTNAYKKQSDYSYGDLKSFFLYLDKELDTLEEVTNLLEMDVSKGNDLARIYQDSLNKLDNSKFKITVVFDHGFERLANQAAEALQNHEYQVIKIRSWSWFKEDGDPPMANFFDEGPVLWYDERNERTKNKIQYIKTALEDVFPESMTVRSGETRTVPGISWHPPPEFYVQLWIFQKK